MYNTAFLIKQLGPSSPSRYMLLGETVACYPRFSAIMLADMYFLTVMSDWNQ